MNRTRKSPRRSPSNRLKQRLSGVNVGASFTMRAYNYVVEKCSDTGLYVGYVPGFPGAHSQGGTLDELRTNMQEVVEMLLEDGEPELEAEFIGTEIVKVA
jgi:predicted RNase H-like HicB family nuclease